jgi:PIN domain nuclease of toxin-antitoxin system
LGGEIDAQSVTAYLDTNIVIFLHAANTERLTARAIDKIESSSLLISSMILLELEMLYEKGSIRYSASQILADLNQQLGISLCQLPMAAVMSSALQVKWTREPGDRIIVANAMANNDSPLITSDRRIKDHYPNTIW